MRILLTGKNGQIGYELERSLQGLGTVIAPDRWQLNLLDPTGIREMMQLIKPAIVINAAAYTDVDSAEGEPELAMRINGEAPGVMAEEARKLGAIMIHYSTDYVFNGCKSQPYVEDDVPSPINVYGASKLAGERAVQAANIPYLILRTSWVYGLRGKNFLLTVLRLAREHKQLRIVSDQYGAPTWCRTIAEVTAHVVAQGLAASSSADWWRERSGLYHICASGETSWYGFAEAIFDHVDLDRRPLLQAVSSEEYPRPARRPANSRMRIDRLQANFCNVPDWRESLKLCLAY